MVNLTNSQSKFFDLYSNTNENILLLGLPGTGKSFCVSLLKKSKDYEKGNISLTSSTGTSALNIGGSTLHSWAGVGIADGTVQQIVKRVNQNKDARKRIQSCKTLIIDEGSMISGEFFDKFISVISHLRFKLPRIILICDLFQLPPVFKTDSTYVFESEWFKKLNFKKVDLKEVVRQSDKTFIDALSKIRVGDTSDLSLFESRVSNKIPDNTLVVFCKNVDIDRYNTTKLQEIQSKSKIFRSNDVGSAYQLESLDRSCPAPHKLELKVGAQVMLLKNLNVDAGLVNGTIGKVKDLTRKGPVVTFGKANIEVLPEKWEIIEDKINDSGKVVRKTVAYREQIPLKLAWASTVHKTQGITCDSIYLDLAGCWASGQAYTALSRVRTIDGLTLSSIDKSMIKVDERIINFYKEINNV